MRRALFIKPLPNVRRVIFIATPHRGSFLTEFSVAGLLGRFITLPARIVVLGTRMATRNANDFKFDPNTLETGSLLGRTPSNPVIEAMAATPVAPGIHANSIIAVAGSGPIESGDDGVVKYESAHLDNVESEYIVRSGGTHGCRAGGRTYRRTAHRTAVGSTAARTGDGTPAEGLRARRRGKQNAEAEDN